MDHRISIGNGDKKPLASSRSRPPAARNQNKEDTATDGSEGIASRVGRRKRANAFGEVVLRKRMKIVDKAEQCIASTSRINADSWIVNDHTPFFLDHFGGLPPSPTVSLCSITPVAPWAHQIPALQSSPVAHHSGFPFHVELPKPSQNHPREDAIFQMVTGRTVMLGTNAKFPVTVGEVLRRMNEPESLHQSLLCCMMRIGKIRSNGQYFRNKLAEHGIEIGKGKRKTAEITCYSSLSEAEAVKMAKQLGTIAQMSINFDTVAPLLLAFLSGRVGSRQQAEYVLEAATVIFRVFTDFFERYGDNPNKYNLNPPEDADVEINNFNLLTHGFGTVAMNEVVGVMSSMAQAMQDRLRSTVALDTNCPGPIGM